MGKTTEFPVTITTLEELRLLEQDKRTEPSIPSADASKDDHKRTRLIVIHRNNKRDPDSRSL
jgi:hypothetical protein